LQFNLFGQRSRDLLIPGANILDGESSRRDREFGRWKFNTWNDDAADSADFAEAIVNHRPPIACGIGRPLRQYPRPPRHPRDCSSTCSHTDRVD
jgi:hypothetical protein